MELGELKGRLAEVKSNRDALCKKIAAVGLESSVKQIVVASDALAATNTPLTIRKELMEKLI